jgi:hypothetical protein
LDAKGFLIEQCSWLPNEDFLRILRQGARVCAYSARVKVPGCVQDSGDVTPAFLALNKSPIKSCVNSKTDPPSSVTIQTLAAVFSLSLSPRRACRSFRRHRTTAAPPRAFPTPRSATGRESRARRGPASRSASPSPPSRKTRRRPERRKNPTKPSLNFPNNFS